MNKLIVLLSFLVSAQAVAQTINNATVNITGSYQNVIVSQSGADHSTNLQLQGNNLSVSVTQSGITPQTFNLSVTCYSSCPSSPIVVNQY